MSKPIIGIVAKPEIEYDMWRYMEIVDDIRHILINNEALVVGVLPTDRKLVFKEDEDIDKYILSIEEKNDLEETINKLDGIILEGGLVSNIYEEEIARICIEKDIPLIGICSGFNNLVRALDGKVHNNVSIFHNQFGVKIAHEIEIDENSKLFDIMKRKKILVNSIHTRVAYENEIKNCKVVAKCPIDNTVEAIELENKQFIMGIKWHPELMEDMNPIFKEFVKVCKKK